MLHLRPCEGRGSTRCACRMEGEPTGQAPLARGHCSQQRLGVTGLQTVVQLFGEDVCGQCWFVEPRLCAAAPGQDGLVRLLERPVHLVFCTSVHVLHGYLIPWQVTRGGRISMIFIIILIACASEE